MIIDEFSVIGLTLFGWINRRCRQATGKVDIPFAGLSVILVGDIGEMVIAQGKIGIYFYKETSVFLKILAVIQ